MEKKLTEIRSQAGSATFLLEIRKETIRGPGLPVESGMTKGFSTTSL
jgi:hypothetical protein